MDDKCKKKTFKQNSRRKLESTSMPQQRHLPKLIACMTKQSLENMRNKALYSMESLDMKQIRRRKLLLHECLILELKEAGYIDLSVYVQDLLYDNAQLVAEDDIGIVVDLRTRNDYLEHICGQLQIAEREREKESFKKECEIFLNLALHYKEEGKGILWLAEKFFLTAIAVASKYQLDGGRLKALCKYHYALFLMDKFPGADPEEPFEILTDVRDTSIGKTWPLQESDTKSGTSIASESVDNYLFTAVSKQLHRVLLQKSKAIRKSDPAKGERLARLAQRRASDARVLPLVAEAIIEVGICQLMMNNLNNARNTFERALKLNTEIDNIDGICNVKMNQAAVFQKLGNYDLANQRLTEMGALAMEYGLRCQLGQALHLLGELHMRNERPELGTMHLAEAFRCFLGKLFTDEPSIVPDVKFETSSAFGIIMQKESEEMYRDEAEQSRLMMAICSGQEKMASYFDLIRRAKDCTVERMKCIEWKLHRAGWWEHRLHLNLLPCMCPEHKRTPLDILKIQVDKILREMHPESVKSISFSLKGNSTHDSSQKKSDSEMVCLEEERRDSDTEQMHVEEEQRDIEEEEQKDIDKVQSSVQEVPSGVEKVQSVVQEVPSGVEKVQSGVQKVASGVEKVQSGVQKVASDVEKVQSGVQKVVSGVGNVQKDAEKVQKQAKTEISVSSSIKFLKGEKSSHSSASNSTDSKL